MFLPGPGVQLKKNSLRGEGNVRARARSGALDNRLLDRRRRHDDDRLFCYYFAASPSTSRFFPLSSSKTLFFFLLAFSSTFVVSFRVFLGSSSSGGGNARAIIAARLTSIAISTNVAIARCSSAAMIDFSLCVCVSVCGCVFSFVVPLLDLFFLFPFFQLYSLPLFCWRAFSSSLFLPALLDLFPLPFRVRRWRTCRPSSFQL